MTTESNIHIGKEIFKVLEQKKISQAEFGRRIGIQRQNVKSILSKSSMDTEKLEEICKVLDFDFFSLFTPQKQQMSLMDSCVLQHTDEGDNLNGSVKIVGGSDKWFELVKKKDEQMDRLIAIIENMQKNNQ